MVSTIFSSTTQSQDVVLINRGFCQYASWGLDLVQKTILSKANKDLKKKMQLKKAVVTETQTFPLFYIQSSRNNAQNACSQLSRFKSAWHTN